MTQNLTLTTLSKEELQEAIVKALANQTAVPEAKPDKSDKSDNMPKLLTIADLSKYFGVSRVTIHAWMKQGRLPFYKVSSRVYFKLDEVLESMKRYDMTSAATLRKSFVGGGNGK